MCVCIYIYIYICIEREICVHIYIYIYISYTVLSDVVRALPEAALTRGAPSRRFPETPPSRSKPCPGPKQGPNREQRAKVPSAAGHRPRSPRPDVTAHPASPQRCHLLCCFVYVLLVCLLYIFVVLLLCYCLLFVACLRNGGIPLSGGPLGPPRV